MINCNFLFFVWNLIVLGSCGSMRQRNLSMKLSDRIAVVNSWNHVFWVNAYIAKQWMREQLWAILSVTAGWLHHALSGMSPSSPFHNHYAHQEQSSRLISLHPQCGCLYIIFSMQYPTLQDVSQSYGMFVFHRGLRNLRQEAAVLCRPWACHCLQESTPTNNQAGPMLFYILWYYKSCMNFDCIMPRAPIPSVSEPSFK